MTGSTRTAADRESWGLSLLGGIVRAAVRADSPDMLYLDACRLAVESGLFRAAWIGLENPAGDGVRLLARQGALPEHDGCPAGWRLARHVQRHGELQACNDVSALPFDLTDGALRTGEVASLACVPLREEEKVVAVLVLCAEQAGAFGGGVAALLHEVGSDISYSLAHMLGEQRRLAAESKLYYMAFYDARTGLPNRALLEERLPVLASGGGVALLDIRLHRLDRALHLFGRLAMDDVIRLLAGRLDARRESGGVLAHPGQDEFALVLPGRTDEGGLHALAHSLLAALEEPVRIGEREVFLRASIGIAIYPLHEGDIGQLLRRARAAADYHGTEGGIQLYTGDLDRGLEQRARTEQELHRALERGEFALHYQPQLSLRTGAMVGVEALLHWRRPQGIVGPGQFVSLLEDCGLMPAVGSWVLRHACRQAKEWLDMGLPPLRMGVNLSALQFRLAEIASIVRSALDEAGLPPEHLELELTESLILENVEQTIQAMHELKRIGVSLALDDFGTGYSSLSYLRRYPVGRIKIDQSFIREMVEHPASAALVRSILAMAHNLGLHTIAEGVENIGQLEYLRRQPCDEMQGFLFSRAVPADDIARMLREGRGLMPDPDSGGERASILLVDARQDVSGEMAVALRRAHWNVFTASSPQEALSLLASNGTRLVACGLDMADGTSARFLERLRDIYPDTMCVLLAPREADAQQLIDAVNAGGVYKVLTVPVDPAELAACMHAAYRDIQLAAK